MDHLQAEEVAVVVEEGSEGQPCGRFPQVIFSGPLAGTLSTSRAPAALPRRRGSLLLGHASGGLDLLMLAMLSGRGVSPSLKPTLDLLRIPDAHSRAEQVTRRETLIVDQPL